MAKPLFLTSVVGSMPRSNFVQDIINEKPPLSPERYEAEMSAAVRYIVALQEHCGLDVVSDGEWRRKSYLGVIADLAHGFELGYNPADNRPWTIAVDKLAPKNAGVIASEIAFLKTITSRKIKATLPAPALLGERLWDVVKSTKAYPSRDDFVRDCVPILRREVELIREAGADIIQIDDPHLCLFVDPAVRSAYRRPDAAADFAVDMTNAVIGGINGVTLAVHLCRRSGARVRGEVEFEGGYEPIIPQLNKLKVHQLTLEFTTRVSGSVTVFKKLREDFAIGLGCVSVEPGQIDSVESIAARVRLATEYIAPERITLNPDCGFAPGSGAAAGIGEAYRKLCNEVAAAKLLREEFA